MALKPTIYKFKIDLSDLDRSVFEALNLTVARHPSETAERMMARVLAYCHNAQPGLEFCKGLSDTDEAALWRHELDGTLDLWIDVGEPSVERIKKASRLAKSTKVYAFNSKADTWWEINRAALESLPITVLQWPWSVLQELAASCERTTEMSVTLTDGNAFVAGAQGSWEIPMLPLHNV